jgi:hypothetical protein
VCYADPHKNAVPKENHVNQDRIRNILLSVIALLLFVNLVVTFAPPVHAGGQTGYATVKAPDNPGRDPSILQPILAQMSAQGWEYVGNIQVGGVVLIFKK